MSMQYAKETGVESFRLRKKKKMQALTRCQRAGV